MGHTYTHTNGLSHTHTYFGHCASFFFVCVIPQYTTFRGYILWGYIYEILDAKSVQAKLLGIFGDKGQHEEMMLNVDLIFGGENL